MPPDLSLKDELLARYFDLFVNRRAYTVQAVTGSAAGKTSYYYRPKDDRYLSFSTIRKHLLGEVTIGLYAINPVTQRCKWTAIDADYQEAFKDLLKLQWELSNDGIDSALERSRRGGHLWIFAQQSLLAADCRRYVQSLAARVCAPVRGVTEERSAKGVSAEGIEIFPKQDRLFPGEFGNAIRAPLGVHRRDGKRYWFYGADYEVDAQLEYLTALRKISREKISRLLSELPAVEEGRSSKEPSRRSSFPPPQGTADASFSLMTHIRGRMHRVGRNYFMRCPSCARRGRDRHGDNLAISVAEPGKYRCWAGCTKEEIRAALGLSVSGMYCRT